MSSNNQCPLGQDCEHYGNLRNYFFDLVSYNHVSSSFHPTIPCRYGSECYSFQRLAKGGFRMDDRCHVIVYGHPGRAHLSRDFIENMEDVMSITPPVLWESVEENIKDGYFIINYRDFDDRLRVERKIGFCNDSQLERELIMNGYDEITSEFLESLNEKLNHERHQAMKEKLTHDEMLSVMCYTGTEAYKDMRKCMLSGNYSKWPTFQRCLRSAILKLHQYDTFDKSCKLYHGLSNRQLNLNGNKFIVQEVWGSVLRILCTVQYYALCYPTFISTTRDIGISQYFMKSNDSTGCLFEFQSAGKCPVADVSWISKFPGEQEVLVIDYAYISFGDLVFDNRSAVKANVKVLQDEAKDEYQLVSCELVGAGIPPDLRESE